MSTDDHAPVHDRSVTGRVLPRPVGILLDFGGVIAETAARPRWVDELTGIVCDRLAITDGHSDLSPERVRTDILAGTRADSRWKNAMSRPRHPTELPYATLWGDFIAADWPAPLRAQVVTHAQALCADLVRLREDRALRPGIVDFVSTAVERGHAVGIVSNTLGASVYRSFIADSGLEALLGAQIYSDEAGLRKPNPDLLSRGAAALDLSIGDCWYVGDNFDRDVLCGWRAGVGGNVLMEASGTWDLPFPALRRPDAIVGDAAALAELLIAAS